MNYTNLSRCSPERKGKDGRIRKGFIWKRISEKSLKLGILPAEPGGIGNKINKGRKEGSTEDVQVTVNFSDLLKHKVPVVKVKYSHDKLQSDRLKILAFQDNEVLPNLTDLLWNH